MRGPSAIEERRHIQLTSGLRLSFLSGQAFLKLKNACPFLENVFPVRRCPLGFVFVINFLANIALIGRLISLAEPRQ
jgi:hypothetical protein